mmetsp:Transcript_1622/g.2251  ORF Transcript_1622/g.2251 Transcript_1622/m.2251 type:complete len:366 (+) Transcript_1622:942-2039(+)|eukprot:CAMPEP_0170071858 /NCGR_PEP_ID=MMETSP0019_2-20121128/9659_1 /TAXON_ID=98059 /ORGANISM="Dinobryon sp., Strain UTEXLB2267" /LENGTH=365 /DNA_ID=CAMNT_0010280575 /DNA_START=864 /DNA_END=1961 /DNA_ORIENTATION=+
MDITKSSPYAAPNTPIASSKRPRITTKDIKSPCKPIASSSNESIKAEAARKHAHSTTNGHSHAVPPPTPSKIMFSPGLRNSDGSFTVSRSIYSESEMGGNDENFDTYGNAYQEETTSSTNDCESGRMATEDDKEVEEEEEEVFNPYLFISGLPEHSTVAIKNKICLSPNYNSGRLTLALDLDETLVHCTVEPIEKPDLVFPVAFNGSLYQVYVRKRPYLDYFLETVTKSFEVVVFTASQKVYADVLLDHLDPGRKLISHRLFREACLLVQGNYLKDLEVIGRHLGRSILVDNSPHAYGYQIDNGIPIVSWYDDDSDTELLKLIGFLKKISDVEDVRPIVREHFKTYQLIANAKLGLPFNNIVPPF